MNLKNYSQSISDQTYNVDGEQWASHNAYGSTETLSADTLMPIK